MPRNPTLTRQRLIDAGSREFASRGFAGARVDEIARSAGVNKERIYPYFGDKRGLFAAVLEAHLAGAHEAVELTGTGRDAVIDYACDLALRHRSDATLARLLHWEALELEGPVALAARQEQMAKKIDAVRRALPQLDRASATALLHDILLVANTSAVLGNIAATLPPAESSAKSRGADELRERMTRVVAAFIPLETPRTR